jgi:tetratricopeptide (TPR) repeat protein
VAALDDGAGAVDQRLIALVRKELVRPDRPQLRGDDAYRFRHLLIRDAAYDALPKATRADLHARFARWIEQHGRELVELDEILGYHLEQACLYRAELGLDVEEEVRDAARRHLTDAGRRAIGRSDFAAGSHLVRRALALVPEGEIDASLEVDLADALFFSGSPEEGRRSLDAAAERAAAAGDRIGELCARLNSGVYKFYLEPQGGLAELDAIIAEVSPELVAAGDDFALYLVYSARSQVARGRGRSDEDLAALEQMVYHARRTGLQHIIDWVLTAGSVARLFGSTPLTETLAWHEERDLQFGRDWRTAGPRAMVLALLGRFDEARELEAEFKRANEERDDLLGLGAHLSMTAATLELLAGDPAAAAMAGERGCRILEDAGERASLSTGACCYAQALYELGRLDEAEEWARKGSEVGDSEDAATQMLARQVQAKVLARRASYGEAESMAREAVSLADGTDWLVHQGDARRDLAEVLELAGRREEATVALREALEYYERKGAAVPAGQVREHLLALEPASA